MNLKSKKTSLKTRKNQAAEEIPDKLPTRSFKSMSRNRSFVLYGRSGTGKTTIALSFPGKVLLLDVKDRGTDSVSDIEPEQGVGMDIENWDDFEMVYYYLKKNPDEYGSIVIDTMSQLQTLCMHKILEDKKKDASRAGDWGTMTKREWGEVAALMKEWIINYRDLNQLGMEVVFIAQDRVFNMSDEDDTGDNMLTPEVGPGLSPSIAKCLNAAVSFIGNTFIRRKEVTKEVNGKKKTIVKKQYCLRIGPSELYITKARKPKSIMLPDVLVDPDYDYIIETLKGE